MNKNKTYGVIGVCGANGNLIARILKQRGFNVIGTDYHSKRTVNLQKPLKDMTLKYTMAKLPKPFSKKRIISFLL